MIALKNAVEIYAWAPKPYHKFMAFKVSDYLKKGIFFNFRFTPVNKVVCLARRLGPIFLYIINPF